MFIPRVFPRGALQSAGSRGPVWRQNRESGAVVQLQQMLIGSVTLTLHHCSRSHALRIIAHPYRTDLTLWPLKESLQCEATFENLRTVEEVKPSTSVKSFLIKRIMFKSIFSIYWSKMFLFFWVNLIEKIYVKQIETQDVWWTFFGPTWWDWTWFGVNRDANSL